MTLVIEVVKVHSPSFQSRRAGEPHISSVHIRKTMGYFAKSRLPLNILLVAAQQLAKRASFGLDITGQIVA